MSDESLLEFPAHVAVKAMGLNTDGFEDCVKAKVLPLITDDNVTVTSKPSKEGKYLSVSVRFTATDLSHLKRIYAALSDEPRILYRL